MRARFGQIQRYPVARIATEPLAKDARLGQAQRARRHDNEADFDGPERGFGFGPGFIFGTEADFESPRCFGFGPGFSFGTEPDTPFLNPPTRGDGDVCFLKPPTRGRGDDCFLNPTTR